jgi:hypothetical protein
MLCDVLVMIWGMEGRDAEALIPIIYLLRNRYKLKVVVYSVFEEYLIDLLRPRVLLTNGCSGSRQTANLTKYAKERGVFVVSLHAEGMIRKENLRSAIIGWNATEQPTVNKWFFWNNESIAWAINDYPQFEDVLAVAGSTLHEKYQIFSSTDFSIEKLKRFQFSKGRLWKLN